MPELATFQREFARALEQPMPKAAPMRVYLNTVMLGAIEALAANFPVTQAILGEQAFEALALPFARRYPPEIPVLACYGKGFGDWLAGQPIARELAYLADVARCEELHTQALHAADSPVLDPGMLQAMPPERLPTLRLRLHPAARFGWFETPAMVIWLAHREPLTDEIAPEWRAAGGLFTRPGLGVEGYELDPPSHRLLAGIRLGENLGAAARASSLLYPDASIGDCFAALVAGGAFASQHH